MRALVITTLLLACSAACVLADDAQEVRPRRLRSPPRLPSPGCQRRRLADAAAANLPAPP